MKKLGPLYVSEPSALLWNMHQFRKVILCQSKWNIANCPKYSAVTLEYCMGLHSQSLPCLMSEILASSRCVIMLTWQKTSTVGSLCNSHYVLMHTENSTGSTPIGS